MWPHKNLDSFPKGALSGLRIFLASESPLKMMNFFFITLKSSIRSQDI